MKSKFFLIPFLSPLFITFCSPQVLHQSEIDEKLSDANQALIYKENRIVLVLTNYSLKIKNCNDKLKGENVKSDLSNALENYMSLIQQLSTLKSYQTYENISTCGDINKKITLMDFEERKTQSIMAKIIVNITSVNKASSNVLLAYNLNLRSLGYLSINERSVFNIIRNTSLLITEYLDYNRILTLHISKLLRFKFLLTVFKKNYCKCLTTVSWTGSNSTLELNIQFVEDQLIAEEKNIVKLTSNALAKVKSAALSSLQSQLNNILTTSDYPKITWPNIKNCNDFWSRLKFLQFKQMQYLGVYQSASLNYSRVVSSRSGIILNTATQTVRNAIKATMAVETRFKQYTSLLIYSIVKMARMIADFYGFGDTFCSCEIESIATTTMKQETTTIKGITTTTVKPTSTSTIALTTTLKNSNSSTTANSETLTSLDATITSAEPLTTTILKTSTSLDATTTSAEPLTTTTLKTSTSLDATTTSTTNLGISTSLGLTTTAVHLSTTISEQQATTTTATPSCGTFVHYDTVNAINAPELFGFEGGMNRDGITKQYVGYGNASCGQSKCPGYINTTPGKAGCYMACGTLYYDGKTSFYILNHPNLKWIPSDITAMRTLPGAISIVGNDIPFLFGRIKYNNQWTLGKVHNGAGTYKFFIQGSFLSIGYETGFEVLTCAL